MNVRFVVALAAATLFEGSLSAQSICPPQARWQASFGTSIFEEAKCIRQTPDGGFIVGGSSYGYAGDGTKTSPNFGGFDFYLIRLDADGHQLWDKSFGGEFNDRLSAVEKTQNGFILGGVSASAEGGSKNSPYYGANDFWVVLTDDSGTELWDKSFGGSRNDELSAVLQTSDGGFLLGGSSESFANGNKSSTNFGAYDFWVVRLDAAGNKLWDKSFGGRADDELTAIKPMPDGGFILGGWSASTNSGNKTAVLYGQVDYWLVRIDADGNKLWDKSYGGDWNDVLGAITLARNGDILAAGQSASPISGNKTIDRFGDTDFWVLRLDPSGNILWQNVYGGTSTELFQDAASAGDGFILAGTSWSGPDGSKTATNVRYSDYWVVRIDGAGNQVWDASFGTMGSDGAKSVIATADNGYAVAGESDYTGGDKTAPSYGYSDIWVLKLAQENASDCDNDGVPNAQDLCDDSPYGTRVDTNGCSLVQLCPCQGTLSHAEYVSCVERVSADFVAQGVMTPSEREALLVEAQEADCPPSMIRFGLVHLPMAGTIVNSGEEGSFLDFRPMDNQTFGVTVLLGEADSGIFIDPDAGGWGNSDPNWFLEGKVYGQSGNGSNALLAQVRVTKPNIETYPVHVDLTPIGPTNLTFQYSYRGVVDREESVAGAVGEVTINTSAYLGPRVNPLALMPDGTLGVLIEFKQSPLDGHDAIFVRADGVTQHFDHISRVEAVGGGGLEGFSIVSERLGMFRNRHLIAGLGIFEATNRQLTIKAHASENFGTTIEFPGTQRFEADFLPINLSANQFTIYAPFYGGSVGLFNDTNGMAIRADFSAVWPYGESNLPPANASVEVDVFRNGILVGNCVGANNSILGYLLTSNQQPPRVIGCVATASSNVSPAIAFSVDQVAILYCANGAQISGTHFKISPVSPNIMPCDISTLTVAALSDPQAFTITGERIAEAQPRLTIDSSDTAVTLSWRDNTRLFRLESSPSLPNGFTSVPAESAFTDGLNQITLSRDTTGSRFFRLRSAPD